MSRLKFDSWSDASDASPQDEGNNLEADVNAKVIQHVLCTTCQHVVDSSRIIEELLHTPDSQQTDEEHYPHLGSEDELQRSSEKGCHLCSRLLDVAGTSAPTTVPLPPGSNTQPGLTSAPNGGLELTLARQQRLGVFNIELTGSGDAGGPHPVLTCTVSQHGEVAAKNSAVEQPDRPDDYPGQTSINTSSDASFLLAKEWLDVCHKSHPACREAGDMAHGYPGRLLEISQTGEKYLRLRLTESVPGRPAFFALSHTWGGHRTLCLMRDNVQEFLTGIREDSLPQTFCDAVEATRRLGHKYLWIDSLCIIQDSKDDWAVESAIMGDIYRGSACTLSAISAPNSQGGLFATRNPLLYRPCVLKSNGDTSVFVMASPYMDILGLTDGPLWKRGWVLQERVLSPRSLQFSKRGLFWECVQCYATEALPHGDISQARIYTYSRPKAAFYVLSSLARPKDGTAARTPTALATFAEQWDELRDIYLTSGLTYRSDILVAIHGIVQRISDRAGLENVAGLWRELLPQELLWTRAVLTDRFLNDAFDPLAYRAPSWSWASIDVNVFSNRSAKSPEWLSTVKHCHADTLPNGQVTSGSLAVQGPMFEMDWVVKNGEVTSPVPQLPGSERDLEWSAYEDQMFIVVPKGDDGDRILTMHMDYRIRNLTTTLSLLLVRREHHKGGPEDTKADNGLVLQCTVGSRPIYRRVGFFFHNFCEHRSPRIFDDNRLLHMQEVLIE